MYVCVYVCMYVRMYVCMYVHVYMHVYMYVCMYVFLYVCARVCMYVGAENGLLLQLSDMFYFEGTETLGTVSLNFLQLLPRLGFHTEYSLYWTLLHTCEQKNSTSHCASHVWYGQQFELACVMKLIQCTIQAAIVLAICESCCRQLPRSIGNF